MPDEKDIADAIALISASDRDRLLGVLESDDGIRILRWFGAAADQILRLSGYGGSCGNDAARLSIIGLLLGMRSELTAEQVRVTDAGKEFADESALKS